MAAGDRKIKITELHIGSTAPVICRTEWQLWIEDKTGVDRYLAGGQTSVNLGTLAAAGALTLTQVRTQVKAAVIADAATPATESVT